MQSDSVRVKALAGSFRLAYGNPPPSRREANETVKIAFIGRLRDESVFPSPEALKKQIDLDAQKARDLAKRYI